MVSSDLKLLVPRWVRGIPADLNVTIILVLLTDLGVLVPGVNETQLRIVLGLPLVLFLPGYAFIAALFPEAGERPSSDDTERGDGGSEQSSSRIGNLQHRGIDGLERVVLSFGLSIAIVPLIGLVLNFTPWGIRLLPVLLGISGFTVLVAVVATIRRWELPADERFVVPYRDWLAAGRREFFQPDTRTDSLLNVLLVLSIVLAMTSVAYAIAVPKPGEDFTECYLLTEDDDGELVADDYPTEFVMGESKSIVIGIGNQEHETTLYSVVIELQRVRFVGNETRVRGAVELNRLTSRVDHNETRHIPYQVRPTLNGTRLRLAFLLYQEVPPPEPTVENAYRELHLWINVSKPR